MELIQFVVSSTTLIIIVIHLFERERKLEEILSILTKKESVNKKDPYAPDDKKGGDGNIMAKIDGQVKSLKAQADKDKKAHASANSGVKSMTNAQQRKNTKHNRSLYN
jgi:hypothetical protein